MSLNRVLLIILAVLAGVLVALAAVSFRTGHELTGFCRLVLAVFAASIVVEKDQWP